MSAVAKEEAGCLATCVSFALIPAFYAYWAWSAALLWSWGLDDVTGVSIPAAAWVLVFALKPLVFKSFKRTSTDVDWWWWYGVQIAVPAFCIGTAWVALWVLGVVS